MVNSLSQTILALRNLIMATDRNSFHHREKSNTLHKRGATGNLCEESVELMNKYIRLADFLVSLNKRSLCIVKPVQATCLVNNMTG